MKALISLNQASVYVSSEKGARPIWTGVTFDICVGEWIAVAGSNGSGKSTLANVLLGLSPLSAGAVTRREGLRMRAVLQSPDGQFAGETIEEEFQYAPEAHGLAPEQRHLLCLDALSGIGLNLPPEHAVETLSGGQKQLVLLAFALAAKPDLLLLDEPTAMVDPAARSRLVDVVRQANRRGTSIVWITHRPEELTEAGRVLALGEQSVAFDGMPRGFFYSETEGASSPCRRLGMEPPFVVQTAEALRQRGIRLRTLPLHADELAEAVTGS